MRQQEYSFLLPFHHLKRLTQPMKNIDNILRQCELPLVGDGLGFMVGDGLGLGHTRLNTVTSLELAVAR
jgi:hypothetical protein